MGSESKGIGINGGLPTSSTESASRVGKESAGTKSSVLASLSSASALVSASASKTVPVSLSDGILQGEVLTPESANEIEPKLLLSASVLVSASASKTASVCLSGGILCGEVLKSESGSSDGEYGEVLAPVPVALVASGPG